MTDEQKAATERQFAWRLAGFLKSRRKAKGWSQRDLAEHADLAQSTISDYERSDRKKMPNVTKQELQAIGSQKETQDAFMRFAEILLMDIARAWEIARPEERQRVQNLLFADGLHYSPELGILNRSNSSLFSMLEGLKCEEGWLASPTGFEPVRLDDGPLIPKHLGHADH
jgi:transcriptional regulator with XRE-family HTH domain